MSLLFETIRVKDRKFLNVEYHNNRLNNSRATIFRSKGYIHLETEIAIPPGLNDGINRCRVEYAERIGNVLFTHYTPRNIQSLQLVNGDDIDYSHKFVDRSALQSLLADIRADDILIVKNGLVTDSSHANIVFFDGREWVTPAKPLLCGTARARLLAEGVIREMNIRREDLQKFTKAVLINAMLGFDPGHAIDVTKITT